jgi:hypothetical protein
VIGRLVTWGLLGIMRFVLFGLSLLWRVALGLLGRVGFRGGRLFVLAVTFALVGWWAAPIVGMRPAVSLAAILWTVWLTRHQRAKVAESAAVKRLTAEVDRYAHSLSQAARRPAPVAVSPSSRSSSSSRSSRPTPRPQPVKPAAPMTTPRLEPVFPRPRRRRRSS